MPGHTQLPLASNEPSHATAPSRRGLATVFSAQQWPVMGCVVVGLFGGKIHSRLCLACLCFRWSLPSMPLMLECNVGLHLEKDRDIRLQSTYIGKLYITNTPVAPSLQTEESFRN